MELKQFLIKAKANSYASGKEGTTLPGDGKELSFAENEFTYKDRYFGENPFIGEEIIWKNERVVWGMNFYGGVSSKIAPVGDVYEFLQQALRAAKDDQPFRGPEHFAYQNFEYRNDIQGTIEAFTGVECIFYQDEEVYRLAYHGGIVTSL